MPVVRLVLAAAVGAALAPPLAALPATAGPTPDGCGTAKLSASAGADLLRVQALDPRAIHLPAPPVGLRLATTRAELATLPTRSLAAAHGVDSGGVPGQVATQQAPPAPAGPGVQVHSPAVAVGAARVGTGDLRAQAGYRCDAGTLPVASASASLADATVLPGAGGVSLLRLPGNLASDAAAALTVRDHRTLTTVTARIEPTDLRLFDGAAGSVQVRVLTPPVLTVSSSASAGRSPVQYTSPLIEVRLPSGTTDTLNTPSKQLDVPVTPKALTALGLRTSSSSGPVVVRLSIGAVTQHVTAGTATAEAATLRVQVLCGGVTAAEFGIGVLSGSASGGTGAAPVPGPASATAPGSLPVTGINVGWLLGIGLLLAIGGRLLLVLGRRRAGGNETVSPAEGGCRSPEPAPEPGN